MFSTLKPSKPGYCSVRPGGDGRPGSDGRPGQLCPAQRAGAQAARRHAALRPVQPGDAGQAAAGGAGHRVPHSNLSCTAPISSFLTSPVRFSGLKCSLCDRFGDLGRKLGEMWHALSEPEKEDYRRRAREVADAKMKSWKETIKAMPAHKQVENVCKLKKLAKKV